MAKRIVFDNEKNIMFHHTGITRYTGCQCFGDCSCMEDFKPKEYDYYTVVRKGKKTTWHQDINSANERWEYVNTL